MICRNCGAQMGENDKFCMVCGTKAEVVISDTVEPTPVEETATTQDVAADIAQVQEEIQTEQTETQEIKPEPAQQAQSEQPQQEQSEPAQQAQSEPVQQSAPSQPSGPRTIVLPKSYKPIGMWGYFGYDILFSIPIVGLICIIIFAFGESNNKNLRNYARSKFCWAIIALVASAIFFLLVLFGGIHLDWHISR